MWVSPTVGEAWEWQHLFHASSVSHRMTGTDSFKKRLLSVFIRTRYLSPVHLLSSTRGYDLSLLCHLQWRWTQPQRPLQNLFIKHNLPCRLVLIYIRTFHRLPKNRSARYNAEPTVLLWSPRTSHVFSIYVFIFKSFSKWYTIYIIFEGA